MVLQPLCFELVSVLRRPTSEDRPPPQRAMPGEESGSTPDSSARESGLKKIAEMLKAGEGVEINVGDQHKLLDLKRKRDLQKKELKKASQVIRNEERKKHRLLAKAKNLPENDLLQVLRLRCEQKDAKDRAKKKRAELAAQAREVEASKDTEDESDDK